jgi:hypothetical protein
MFAGELSLTDMTLSRGVNGTCHTSFEKVEGYEIVVRKEKEAQFLSFRPARNDDLQLIKPNMERKQRYAHAEEALSIQTRSAWKVPPLLQPIPLFLPFLSPSR